VCKDSNGDPSESSVYLERFDVELSLRKDFEDIVCEVGERSMCDVVNKAGNMMTEAAA